MNYEELLLLFCKCLVVPGAVAIAPGTMTRSSFARVTFQVYSVGVGLFGFLHLPVGPLRNSVFAVSLMTLIQYWVLVWWEGIFEGRYGRTPHVTFLVSRLHTKWEDRLMSLAYAFLGLATGIAAMAVVKTPASKCLLADAHE